VSPHQAAKSRAEANCLPSPIAVTMALRGQRANAGNVCQPPHHRMRARRDRDLPLQGGDCHTELLDLPDQHGQGRRQRRRNAAVAAGDQLCQFDKAAPALRRNDAKFGQLAAHAVHQLRVLLDQQVARPFDPTGSLLLDALDGNKPHIRPPQRRTDRRRVPRIGLVALDERLHIGRGNEPHSVAELPQRARPIMRRPTGLDANQCRRQFGKEIGQLRSPQPFLQNNLIRFLTVHLENSLRDIQANRGSVHSGRSSRWLHQTRQLGTSDAVRGPSTQHCEEPEGRRSNPGFGQRLWIASTRSQ
jgi:hypothetical protein